MAPDTLTTGGWSRSLGANHEQAGGELVGRGGRPDLPGADDLGGVSVRPDQVKCRRWRRRDGTEDQGRDDAEVAAAGAAQRPEQVRFIVLVALDNAAIRQDHLCPEQVIGRKTVPAAEDAHPAAEGETRDPDRGAAAGRDGEPVPVQRVVHLAQARPCTHRRHATRDRHGAHRR